MADDDSISNLKRGIEHEIERIDRKIVYIAKLKDEAIANLMQQKQECHEKEALGEIERELDTIQKQHEMVIERQKTIHDAKKEYLETVATLEEIDKELGVIQERHEEVVVQLNEKRDFLKDRLGSIETLDTMKVKIENEMEEELESYENQKQRLSAERKDLLARTDLSATQMESALRNIDDGLEQLEGDHVRSVNKLSQAAREIKGELSKTLSPTERKAEILEELKKLRAQALSATPSELAVIEARIEELNKELEHLEMMLNIQEGTDEERLNEELEARGLKLTPSGRLLTASGQIKTIEEAREAGLLDGMDMSLFSHDKSNFLELLEQRGLHMTPSGRIRTEDGEVYTMEEARKMGLLQGLETELLKMRGLTVTASGHIMTSDGKVLTRAEAEELGLLDGINFDDLFGAISESETNTESLATSESGLSTSDVRYLKNVLGRPLTLALAEITAKQPRDPIHYLGHWMYKYRYNQEVDDLKKRQFDEMMEERDRLAKEALRKEAESEAKAILLEILGRLDQDSDQEDDDVHMDDEPIDMGEDAELESEARDTLGVYDGPTRGQQLI